MTTRIQSVDSWQVLDSRGDPSVAVGLTLADGSYAMAIAPAGASAGGHEAPFLRDGGFSYAGRSVSELIAQVTPALNSALAGVDAMDPSQVEQRLVELDGEHGWASLGGNVAVATSIACWLAVARATRREPFQVISEWTGRSPSLPMPMINIVSGGAHAASAVDIQDVLVIPRAATSVEQAIEMVWQVRRGTRQEMDQRGYPTALIADEGGLAASFPTNSEALEVVYRGIERAGYRPVDDVVLALDIAANEFEVSRGRYRFEAEEISSAELVSHIDKWVHDWAVVSVEDPLAEDDDWAVVNDLTGRIRVVGDDRYATNVARLRQGIEAEEANTVLIKPNQAGSLWSALQALELAKDAQWHTIVSARSGETEQDWLVDLAVGSGAGQIKVGSTMRSERTAKWNRMLQLSHQTDLMLEEFV